MSRGVKRYSLTLEAISPIAHGDTRALGSTGNQTQFMRRIQLVDGHPVDVPAMSANALRSVMVRKPLHDDLLERLDLGRASINQATVNLLFAGGDLKKGAKEPLSSNQRSADVYDLYPSLALLGGTVDDFMLPRSALRVNSWFVCRENRTALETVAPHLAEAGLCEMSIFDALGEETRTGGTSLGTPEDNKIFTYEVIAQGTQLHVEFTVDAQAHPSVHGALAVALERWDGFIGAKNASEHGRCAVVESNLPSKRAYEEHVDAHLEAMRAGLEPTNGGACLGGGNVLLSD